MARVYGTYSLSNLQRSLIKLSKEVEKMNESVSTNTMEFKKINNKIAKTEEEQEQKKPDWREIPDYMEQERYPLVQESANIPEKTLDLTLKKLDIL